MLVSGVIGNVKISPALLMDSIEGATYVSSLRLICAIPKLPVTAKSYERYPTAPLVCEIPAATPSLPSPPVPAGPWTALSAPTLSSHSGLCDASHDVNTNVVPDSSERWTTAMGIDGSPTPGFCAAISGSFHLVTEPRKMSATVCPSSLRPV